MVIEIGHTVSFKLGPIRIIGIVTNIEDNKAKVTINNGNEVLLPIATLHQETEEKPAKKKKKLRLRKERHFHRPWKKKA